MSLNVNRRTERAAVNALRTLLEANDHIVQEIDAANDHGEDLYVSFTEDRVRTGETIAVQVKGGTSFGAKGGYRVSVRRHADFWMKSNLTVICVVQDATTGVLYWANASQQIRDAVRHGRKLKSVVARDADVLDASTLPSFVSRVRADLAPAFELHFLLSRMAGVVFDTTDYVSYFKNEFGERICFQQRRGEKYAWLLHSDLGWEPHQVSEGAIRVDPILREFGLSKDPFPDTVGDLILDQAEMLWLMACFKASRWYQDEAPLFRP